MHHAKKVIPTRNQIPTRGIWKSKKGDKHFGTVSMTNCNVLLRFTG